MDTIKQISIKRINNECFEETSDSIIVSHSAPTDLALSIAEAANLTVIGFVRGNKMNIYCGDIKES
jgi:formate dehydrogenase accessory protein FdhD